MSLNISGSLYSEASVQRRNALKTSVRQHSALLTAVEVEVGVRVVSSVNRKHIASCE